MEEDDEAYVQKMWEALKSNANWALYPGMNEDVQEMIVDSMDFKAFKKALMRDPSRERRLAAALEEEEQKREDDEAAKIMMKIQEKEEVGEIESDPDNDYGYLDDDDDDAEGSGGDGVVVEVKDPGEQRYYRKGAAHKGPHQGKGRGKRCKDRNCVFKYGDYDKGRDESRRKDGVRSEYVVDD